MVTGNVDYTRKIFVQGSSIVGVVKVEEQGPLSSIQIEPKPGMGNLKCDINAQTLIPVKTQPHIDTYTASDPAPAIAASATTTLLTITDEILLAFLAVRIRGNISCATNSLRSVIDGVGHSDWALADYLQIASPIARQFPLSLYYYDDINFRYYFTLKDPIHCKTSFSLVYINNTANAHGARIHYGYWTL